MQTKTQANKLQIKRMEKKERTKTNMHKQWKMNIIITKKDDKWATKSKLLKKLMNRQK